MHKRPSTTRHLLLGIFLLGYVMVSLSTLGRSPFPGGDEGYYAQAMDTTARTGKFIQERYLGIIGFDRGNTIFGKLYITLGAFALRSGLPDLWSLRFLSFLSLLVALILFSLWLKLIYNGKTALLAAGFMLLSTPVFVASHTVRPECLDLALLSMSLYFAQRSFHSSSKSWALASGLAAGLFPSVHLGSTTLVLLPFLWWALEYRLALFRQRNFWASVLGCAVAILTWIYWHMLPDPTLFFHQFTTLGAVYRSSVSIEINPLYWFTSELSSIWKPYGYSRFGVGIIALSILGFGLIQTAIRRNPQDVKLIGAATGLFLLQTLLSHNKWGWYTVYYLFFFCPLLARAVTFYLDDVKRRNPWRRRTAIILAVVYVIVGALQIGSKIVLDMRSPSILATGTAVSDQIPAGARVCASATIFFTKPTFEWVDSQFLTLLVGIGQDEQKKLGASIQEAMVNAGITYVVAHSDHDAGLAGLDVLPLAHVQPPGPFNKYWFAKHHTDLVKVVDGGRGGNYVIRRIIQSK